MRAKSLVNGFSAWNTKNNVQLLLSFVGLTLRHTFFCTLI